ncbi:hypothetical protein AAG570_000470 [Ranatra chinensis]|uniref:PRKR-interacting protein 1 n=1 Tax=Ranatra chinensis TaxID=642074 RepID=A0ABD0YX57_9HEMI
MDQTDENKSETKPVVIRNCAGLQRMKLEKLMKNPASISCCWLHIFFLFQDKPVLIPERQKEKKLPHVPEFVRNVMGSSAGAGSGEFHVYRHLRRKEYSRQKYIQEKSEKTKLDEAYQQKVIENKLAAEARTAKKRLKRLKKKAKRQKNAGKSKEKDIETSPTDESSEEEEKITPST